MTPESKQALRAGVEEIFGIDINAHIPTLDTRGHLKTIRLTRAGIMRVLFEEGVAITANQRYKLSAVLNGIFGAKL